MGVADRLGEAAEGVEAGKWEAAAVGASRRSGSGHRQAGEGENTSVSPPHIHPESDAVYVDKLDGKIPEDFWERKMAEWRTEEQQVKACSQRLRQLRKHRQVLDAQRVFELANKAYYTVCFADSDRKGGVTQNATFELLNRSRKYNAHIQIPIRYDLPKCQIG